MAKLVFDIETVGENFDLLDKATQDALTHWIKEASGSSEEYEKKLSDLKESLGFSPLTGEIVAIGVLDYEKNHGVVYYQAPGEKIAEFEEDNIKFKQASEQEMLKSFWEGSRDYNEFISFNGRGFDVPFMVARGAKYRIKPTKDLMSNRYLGSQKKDNLHTDLQDQLSFYGATKRGSLHLWCRHFGIKSPKSEGITGDNVAYLFGKKKYLDIARYNTRDIKATRELYTFWNKFIKQ